MADIPPQPEAGHAIDRRLQVIVAIPAALFVGVGLGWWLAPALLSEQIGMPLLAGMGLSTQVADLASFFLTLGGCMLIGLRTGDRVWFYPPLMLLSLAVIGRLLAWLVHGAALAYDMIVVEVSVASVLVFVLSRPTVRSR